MNHSALSNLKRNNSMIDHVQEMCEANQSSKTEYTHGVLREFLRMLELTIEAEDCYFYTDSSSYGIKFDYMLGDEKVFALNLFRFTKEEE